MFLVAIVMQSRIWGMLSRMRAEAVCFDYIDYTFDKFSKLV